MLELYGFSGCLCSRAKTYRQGVLLSNIISFLIVFIAPIYYPIENIPSVFQIILYFNPLTYGAIGLRESLIGIDNFPYFAIILTLSLLFFLTIFKKSWSEEDV